MPRFGCKKTNNSDELYDMVATYFDKSMSSILLNISQNGAIGVNSYSGVAIFKPFVSNSDKIITEKTEKMNSAKSKKIIKTDLILWV